MNIQTRSHRTLSSRETILATSRDIFFRLGFTEASMDTIAQHSGISKTTLYAHFENKESLFNQVVVDAVKKHGDEAAVLLDLPAEASQRDRLTLVSGRILDKLMQPGAVALMRLCITEGARMPRPSYEALISARSRLLQALAGFLESTLAVADPNEAADLFLVLTARNSQLEAMLPWSAPNSMESDRRNAVWVAGVMLRLYGSTEPSTLQPG